MPAYHKTSSYDRSRSYHMFLFSRYSMVLHSLYAFILLNIILYIIIYTYTRIKYLHLHVYKNIYYVRPAASKRNRGTYVYINLYRYILYLASYWDKYLELCSTKDDRMLSTVMIWNMVSTIYIALVMLPGHLKPYIIYLPVERLNSCVFVSCIFQNIIIFVFIYIYICV